jgi:hypothetical protein
MFKPLGQGHKAIASFGGHIAVNYDRRGRQSERKAKTKKAHKTYKNNRFHFIFS